MEEYMMKGLTSLASIEIFVIDCFTIVEDGWSWGFCGHTSAFSADS
jgi:hypothetical protein